MVFTDIELDYLRSQHLGRLATAQRNGTLQVSPVGFSYNADEGAIDIGGFEMSKSQKYRNVAANGKVAFVVDDLASVQPWRVRCLEIRGRAEVVPNTVPEREGMDNAIIRIHPERIISFGIGDDREPHELVANIRNVTPGDK